MHHRDHITQELFGSIMRVVRRKGKMTQVHVAKHLKMSQSTLSKIENGVLGPSAVDWYLFCQLTGIAPTIIFSKKLDRELASYRRKG